jgi:hypothetical protein
MNTTPVSLFLLLVTTACSDSSLPASPTPVKTPIPTITPTPILVVVRDVAVGERVEGVYGDGSLNPKWEYDYFVTAPRDGTLTVTLTWDVILNGTLLTLKLGESTTEPVGPQWSPIVGRLAVTSGGRYLIGVGYGGSDWLPKDPYVITTALEP